MSGHRVTAPSLRMNRRSHPTAGFHAMKTGKTLPKPAGDRNMFSLWIAMQKTVKGCPRQRIFA